MQCKMTGAAAKCTKLHVKQALLLRTLFATVFWMQYSLRRADAHSVVQMLLVKATTTSAGFLIGSRSYVLAVHT